jgi:hypothetical protein
VSTTSLVRRAVLLMFRRVRQPHVGFGVGEAPCLLDVVPFDCHQEHEHGQALNTNSPIQTME